MRFCPSCGTQLEESSIFCGNCGTRLEKPKVVPDTPQPKTVQPEIPQTAVPQTGMSQTGVPQTITPQPGMPQTITPQPGMPQTQVINRPQTYNYGTYYAPPRKKKNSAPLVIGIVAAVVFAIVAIYGVSSLLNSGSKLNFTLHNDTGVDIYYLYVSPSYSDSWEEDILGDSILYSGDTIPVTFTNDYKDVRYWDIRIEDAYGTYFDWTSVDLFSIKNIYIYIDSFGDVYADMK